MWHAYVKGPKPGAHYAYRVDLPSICSLLSGARRAGADAPPAPGKPDPLHPFNEYTMLIEHPALFGALSVQIHAEPERHDLAGLVSDFLIHDAEEVQVADFTLDRIPGRQVCIFGRVNA